VFSGEGSCFAFPARRIRGALLSHNLKRSTSSSEAGLLTCGQFKATNDSVAISGVKLYQPCPPAGFLGGDQCCARAAEGVEHDLIAARAIPDGIRHQSHRLDRGMYRELSAGAERVDPGVIPDVGPVAWRGDETMPGPATGRPRKEPGFPSPNRFRLLRNAGRSRAASLSSSGRRWSRGT
jgi:hypothetical protein